MGESFFLDEKGLDGLVDRNRFSITQIHCLIQCIEELIEEGEFVSACASIDECAIGEDLRFQDIYSFEYAELDHHFGIDRDLHLRLLRIRGQIDLMNEEPVQAEILSSDGKVIRSSFPSSLASLLLKAEIRHPALLTLDRSLYPEAVVLASEKEKWPIFFISSSADLPLYFRWLVVEAKPDEGAFFQLWTSAFPKLLRADNLSFRRFSTSYEEILPQVVKHLSFLNDDFETLWVASNRDFPKFMQTAKSKCSIDFSNESSKTRNSPKKMRLREAHFSGEVVTCELHSKITRTTNRIHFHPSIDGKFGGKLLVGIFVDHLET